MGDQCRRDRNALGYKDFYKNYDRHYFVSGIFSEGLNHIIIAKVVNLLSLFVIFIVGEFSIE